MNKLYENQIKDILFLLEKSVSTTSYAELEKGDTVEIIAQKHVENQNKIDAIQKQIDALIKQQTEVEDANGVLQDSLLDIIGNTKSQSFRFGKILVDFKVTRDSGVSKSSPQYKKIVEELVTTYKIEEHIVTELTMKFNNGNKPFTNVNKNLSITKESKEYLNESFTNWLKTLWIGFKGVFNNLFMNYKARLDNLDSMISELKRSY